MEENLLFGVLSKEYFDKYRERLDKEDDSYMDWVNEERKKLEKEFSKEQLKLVDSYKLGLRWREDYLDFYMGAEILNYGIKIGMELQEAFHKHDE